MSGGAGRNRLATETSPYLLQHAGNPVDWYAWGDEALSLARAEDRPILLSVGYSACHWCHVMERESFEDDATARLMNEHFVNIKVDREERPDVDAVYMTAVQQMTGRGGWPMTVFLTPEGQPFYGGTYFPPAPRHGMPSFRQVLLAVSEAYRERRGEVERSAAELTDLLRQGTSLRPPTTPLDTGLLDEAFRALAARFDATNGGFGGAPKFPQPMVLDFLLRDWRRTGNPDALGMVEETLGAMARGGIYDHLGGGFHRYSVDARWQVPHFEKMLYDNALLARLYLHAHQATGDPEYRRVAEETLDYVLREMTSPEGGFYSTQDADSEGEEGRFYLWRADEVDRVLGPEDGRLFRLYYGVTPGGNFEGRSILHVERPLAAVAREAGVGEDRVREAVERGRARLYEVRAARVWPGRDDKVITSWNAMTVRALAEGASILDRTDYRDAALRGAEFLLGELRRGGELLRTYRDGVAKIGGFLEDYASLVDALVSLYEATFDARWIREARSLADAMIARFWSPGEGQFYDAAAGDALVVRPRDVNDSATPSGSSAAAMALLRLCALTGEEAYDAKATATVEGVAGLLPQIPQAFGGMLAALDWLLSDALEVAVVGEPAASGTRALLDVVRHRYLPNAVLALRDPAAPDEETAAVIPLLAGRELVDGRPAAYVCERFACRRPVTAATELARELER
ncbi:MAG TPA: thioredoxin domain-containing protein [Longimicrobiaceae bacterium]|nr:thioredoxin domain-containing protein [Longimicrobiaceae bacterium]